MRNWHRATLVLALALPAAPQNPPAGWTIVKDSTVTCQIAVPPAWVLLIGTSGAAVLGDATNAIAVVTSQPTQVFKPLPQNLQKALGIPKQKLFENSPKRLFYQDKTSEGLSDPNALSVSVPSKTGTCSAHLRFLPSLSEETAKKIALSLAPVEDLPAPPTGD